MIKLNKHFLDTLRRPLIVIWCVVFAATSAPAQATDTVVGMLELGKTVDRELKGGQTETYNIPLNSGQFVHLVVEQNGIDVSLSLLGPGGQPVVTSDSPNGSYGSEQIAVVAETSGNYRLEVVSSNKAAPTGRYKITVFSLRQPTETDRERTAAESAFVEAFMKLRPLRTAVARRAAIEKCREALAFFEMVGDRYRQAWIMHTIVLLYAESGEFRKAFDQADQTLPIFRSVKDARGEASTLNFLGGMSDVLGDPQRALGYYKDALVLTRANKNQNLEASLLNNIGKIYNDLADWQKSIDFYNQALSLFRAIGNQRLEAITLHNIGVAYAGLGDADRALDFLQQALPLRRTVGDKAGEADTLTSIGYVYNYRGRSQEALGFYDQALPLRLTVGDRRGEGITLDHIGIAYAAQGQFARALDFHQQALERHRTAKSPRTEAVALGNIGHVYNLLGQFQKAVEFNSQALTIFRDIGDRQNEAKMLEDIAFAERGAGKFGDALRHLDEALNLIEAVRSAAGAQQSRFSYFASRHGAYELYIDLLMQLHRQDPSAGYDAKALQASERVRARSLMELLSEANVNIREGIDPALITRERGLGQTLNAKAQRQIQLRASKGSEEEIAALDREVNALEVEFQQVQASIRKMSPAYAALTQPQPLTLREIQKQLDPNTLLLEYSLGDAHSYLWTVSQSGLKSYELPGRQQIQRNAREVYELLTARGAVQQGETAAQRQERLTRADSQLTTAAAELSRMVISPAAADLGNKRLFIVADDALQYVPFAILPVAGRQNTKVLDRNRTLVLDHEIVSLPSVSALAVQRQSLAGRKPAVNAIAVIADPVFSADDARLKAVVPKESLMPVSTAVADTRKLEHIADSLSANLVIRRLLFTRQEAEQILSVAPRASNLKALDFTADRATAVSAELGRYRFVHFATHGYLDSQRPDLSAIVLSLIDKDGNPQDGFLRAHDIYNLKLSADLVVLSACQTGLGKDIRGEGLVGLTRGFMYAGARRVVVSLWNVNDKATVELMQRFYRGMLRENLTPAAALRKAQAELARDPQWHSPYYWAAFVLQGD